MIDREALRDALRPLLDDPAGSGLLTDFDGTLAVIVDSPGDAVPHPAAPAALGHLSERLARVAVVSGRPLAFLRPLFPAGVVLSGQYGLEGLEDGSLVEHPDAPPWRAVIAAAAVELRSGVPDGVRVEDKGLSLTLHFREHPGHEAPVRAAAAEVSTSSGLVAREARRSVELHPPIDVDKGTSVLALAAGLRSVCFIGDDAGDLPAFDALDDLALDGVHTLRVAVASVEAPAALLERADVVLASADEVVELLQVLLDG